MNNAKRIDERAEHGGFRLGGLLAGFSRRWRGRMVQQRFRARYSQTWTNGTQWYQTNVPNSNPNGVLTGNWTLDDAGARERAAEMTELTEEMLANAERLYRIARARREEDRPEVMIGKVGSLRFCSRGGPWRRGRSG